MEPSPPPFRLAPYDSWLVRVVRVVLHNLGRVKPGTNISNKHWTVSVLVAPYIGTTEKRGEHEHPGLALDLY
jgi:hypothetical protein